MSGAIKINGTSSGSTTITAPASGADETIELSTALAAKLDASAYTAPGLTLITPTSIAYSGGTASLSGSKVVASGVTSISLNGVFSSTHDRYVLAISMAHSAINSFLTARVRASGTDATSGYHYNVGLLTAGFVSSSYEYNSTVMRVMRSGDQTTAAGEIVLYINNPAVAAATSGHADGTYSYSSDFAIRGFSGFWHTGASAYDGITFFTSAGSLTGDIRVYGMEN